jgi:hypothetical protein
MLHIHGFNPGRTDVSYIVTGDTDTHTMATMAVIVHTMAEYLVKEYGKDTGTYLPLSEELQNQISLDLAKTLNPHEPVQYTISIVEVEPEHHELRFSYSKAQPASAGSNRNVHTNGQQLQEI